MLKDKSTYRSQTHYLKDVFTSEEFHWMEILLPAVEQMSGSPDKTDILKPKRDGPWLQEVGAPRMRLVS